MKVKLPKSFLEKYNVQRQVIDRSNFREFVVI